MVNARVIENIKKSLGLTEYPWSSDDDDDTLQMESEPVVNSRSQAAPSTAAEPSASTTPVHHSNSEPSTSRVMDSTADLRNQNIRDVLNQNLRDVLNQTIHDETSPERHPVEPAPGPSRATSRTLESTESFDLTNQFPNLTRIRLSLRNYGRRYAPLGQNENDSISSERRRADMNNASEPNGVWPSPLMGVSVPASTPIRRLRGPAERRVASSSSDSPEPPAAESTRRSLTRVRPLRLGVEGTSASAAGNSRPFILQTRRRDVTDPETQHRLSAVRNFIRRAAAQRSAQQNLLSASRARVEEWRRSVAAPRSPVLGDSASSDDDLEMSPHAPDAAGDETNDNPGEQDQDHERAGGDSQPAEAVDEWMDTTEEGHRTDRSLHSTQAQPGGAHESQENAGDPGTAALPPSKKVKRATEEAQADSWGTAHELNRNLLRLLECPVCLDTIEPPMAQCRGGHLLCAACRARVDVCPVCRSAFSSVRNRAMEGVAELLHFPCRYGCGREVPRWERAAHEGSCTARRYSCPVTDCTHDLLPLALLADHFQASHSNILIKGNRHEVSLPLNVDLHKNWLVMAGRDLFYMRHDVDVRSWGVVVHVAYIGPHCDASRFAYKVTVHGWHNQRKLAYTRITHTDAESVCRHDCFNLPLSRAFYYQRSRHERGDDNRYLDLTVEISRGRPLAVPRASRSPHAARRARRPRRDAPSPKRRERDS